jgi:uncharacterized membrane protein YhfC
MLLTTLFVLEGAFVVAGVVGFAMWLNQRYHVRWRTWIWGAVAFGISQLVRSPVLLGITTLSNNLGFRPDPVTTFWINTLTLSLTAGLFEETARYCVLRWLDKDARTWQDSLMFGTGHGGLEAILIIIPTVMTNLVLLSTGDSMLQQLQSSVPDQAQQLASALALVRGTQWYEPFLAVWERVTAISIHIAATLLIMRAIAKHAPGPIYWWGAAVLFHMAADALALIGHHYGGIVLAEIFTTICFAASLYVIRQLRPRQALLAQSR